MALDPTAREANVKDSIKKYFVDNLKETEGIFLNFDRTVTEPPIHQTTPVSVNRWLSIRFGAFVLSDISQIGLDIFCCTRQDIEGFRLSQLRDTTVGYLTDTDETDTMRRIPFYRSRETGSWTLLGQLLVHTVIESPEMEAPDDTKYKIITALLRWPSKV